jgi:acetolactate synthase-1/2/3 large subunit
MGKTPGETTGAEALLSTLVKNDVDVCLANPGTSEMHFVAAIDNVPGMRTVLGLSEGVVTGACDGYGRIAGKPAAALLHLGPGLSNGLANLHNARRARTPIVTVVGDHATYHKRFDPPLESDIDALAWTVSRWVRRSWRPDSVGPDAAAAVDAARAGGIATMIVPADVSWQTGGVPTEPLPASPPAGVTDQVLEGAERALRSEERTVVLVGGPVVADESALSAAAALAASAGAVLMCETFPARALRGAGRPLMSRLAYPVDIARKQLTGVRHLVLAGATLPIAQFAYPGKPSELLDAECQVHDLGMFSAPGALEHLASVLPSAPVPVASLERPDPAPGELTAAAVGQIVAALMPDDAIVVDESITSGATLPSSLRSAPAHDLLTLPGGAIGFGLPAATGAAIAAAGRSVISLEGDGSAVYTIAALWTQAREQLDVTTVIYDNRSYAILHREFEGLKAAVPGPAAQRLLTLDEPAIDFVAVARGFGVPASRALTVDEFRAQLHAALSEPGPHLIAATIAG